MRRYLFPLLLVGLLVIAVPVLTQRECEALVAKALQDSAENCLGLARNSACYGYSRVDAGFTNAVPDDFFASPADRTDLAPLVTLQTGALNLGTDEWGVALMNIQANLPDTLPGQGVIFVLFGDTTLQDATTAQATRNSQHIQVTTNVNTNFRSGPGLNYNVVMVAEQGTVLTADGMSPDGKWLRVMQEDAPGWIHYTLVKPEGDLTTLPKVDATRYSPMQAFYLKTGLGQSACVDAPNVLLVQGPENYEITLSVNGAVLEMGSTVLFRTIKEKEQSSLEITVLDGRVTLAPDDNNPHPVIIPEGTRSTACLDTRSEQLIVACRWSEPRTTVSAMGCYLGAFPSALLHYPIHAHCSPPVPSNITHNAAVVPASAEVLIQNHARKDENNALSDSAAVLPAVSSADTAAECSGFGLVSGGETLISQFQWTAVSGADEYKMNIYGAEGQIVASQWFPASTTSVSLNIGDFPTGGAFQWEMEALLGGQVLCYTPRSAMMQRPGNPNPSGNHETSSFAISCAYTSFLPYIAAVSWSNADGGDVISISVTDSAFVVYATTGFGAGGTILVSGGPNPFTQITVTTTSGKSALLNGC